MECAFVLVDVKRACLPALPVCREEWLTHTHSLVPHTHTHSISTDAYTDMGKQAQHSTVEKLEALGFDKLAVGAGVKGTHAEKHGGGGGKLLGVPQPCTKLGAHRDKQCCNLQGKFPPQP